MKQDELVYYNIGNIYYASYYLNSFFSHGSEAEYRLKISQRIPAQLSEGLKNKQWQHSLFSVCLFKYTFKGKSIYFCIDTHDINTLDTNQEKIGFHLPLLETVDVYFKVNYNQQAIDQNSILTQYRHKIFPIQQFVPMCLSSLVLKLQLAMPPILSGCQPGLGYRQPFAGYMADARQRVRHLRSLVSKDSLLHQRNQEKDWDVFFVTSFRYIDRHRPTMQRRYQVIKGLQNLKGLRVLAGFTGFKEIPEEFSDVALPRLSQAEYLNKLSKSKLVIYMRGMGDCISSKFALFMALGIPVVGESICNNKDSLYRHENIKQQFAYDEPDEIVNTVEDFFRDGATLQKLSDENAKLFDSEFLPAAVAPNILSVLKAI